jgi:hypothetical protein
MAIGAILGIYLGSKKQHDGENPNYYARRRKMLCNFTGLIIAQLTPTSSRSLGQEMHIRCVDRCSEKAAARSPGVCGCGPKRIIGA